MFLTNLISQLYYKALDCEINPDQFWNLTIQENMDLIESFERRKLSETKQDLLSKHFLAKDIGQFIALSIHGKDEIEIMEIWDFFPELFGDMKEEAEKRKQEQQMELYKAQMLDYVYRHNNRNGGGK